MMGGTRNQWIPTAYFYDTHNIIAQSLPGLSSKRFNITSEGGDAMSTLGLQIFAY